MAEEIACPACETPNEPWNELCDACGAEMHADGDEFVDSAADGDDSGGFEDVDDVQAYDEANPDDSVGLDEDTNAEFDFDEDTQAGQPTEAEYELEAIEPEDGFEASEADWDDDQDQPQDDQFDGGAPLEGSPDDTFDTFDNLEDDDVIADGGVPFDAEQQFDAAGDAFESEEFGADRLETGGDAGFDDDVEDFDADRETDFNEFDEFDAQGDAQAGQEFVDEEEFVGEETSEELQAFSEVDEEPPPPPELEAILNPQQVDRTPIDPLPTPGPYAEMATLTVFRGGDELGEVAIDFNCTVLGLDQPDDTSDAAVPADGEVDDAAFEDEELDDETAFEDDQAEEVPYELEAIDDESEGSFELDESQDTDEDVDNLDAMADSEANEEPAAAATGEDPDDLEEGPVVDLSQFGDATCFARRHGYLFRHNKHYTLYVLSDLGTQINDEVVELGEYRELADGDVVVLGGEVALKFNKPAA
jgi:hypothetical protein